MDDKKKKLEKEFTEFLIQKVKHYGGSMPFQYLLGLLHCVRFEVRDEFGTRKKLMNFLKKHSDVFHIDPSSAVTINLPSSSANDSHCFDDDDDKQNDDKHTKESKIKNIECGKGTIIKLHPEFGIIKACEPLVTNVYFKSDAFNKNKDILLTDTQLQIGCEVYFNAVYGHDDYEVKFCANKVWLKSKADSNLDDNIGNQNKVSSDLEGEGIIQNISSETGFILASGKDKNIVVFYRNSVKDCNDMKLTKIFNVGEHVSFSAYKINKGDSKCQWQATLVRKKSKEKFQSLSHPKSKATVQNRIENEPGKIYPHCNGADIKFRNSEEVDGSSSSYFLYGTEVSKRDIAFEFSEGDDVYFNAIKTKTAPGWKALLVWVGEKPDYVNSKIHSDEEMCETFNNNNNNETYQKSDFTTNLNSKSLKSETNTSIDQQVLVDAVPQNKFQLDLECKKEKFKTTHRSFKNSSLKSNRKGKFLIGKNKGGHNGADVETEVMHKSNFKNSKLKRLKGTKLQSNTKVDAVSSYSDENDDNEFCYKDNESDISEKSFSDDQFCSKSQNNKLLMEEMYNESFASTSQHDFVNFDETEINTDDELDDMCENRQYIEYCKNSVDRKPSIKKFEDIEGEIINLYCKAAIVESLHLQQNIDFLLNVFYIDGKSVEEQQVIDLKEIIKVGDHINFNCFEIVDDFGVIHQTVTVAWIGPKPNVNEITPQQFIDDLELSVTIRDDLVSEHSSDERKICELLPAERNHLLADMCSSADATVIKDDSAICLLDSSSKDPSDNKMQLNITKTDEQEENYSSVHAYNLSQKIVHRLRDKGVIFKDLKTDFSDVVAQVIRIVEEHGSANRCKSYSANKEVAVQVCSSCSEKKSVQLSCQNKSENHAAVQTIITGAIVAQSIYTQT